MIVKDGIWIKSGEPFDFEAAAKLGYFTAEKPQDKFTHADFMSALGQVAAPVASESAEPDSASPQPA